MFNFLKYYNNHVFKESKKSDRSDQKFLAILQYSLVFS